MKTRLIDPPQPPEKIAPPEKRCTRCDLPKPITDFYANKNYRDGYKNICKSCHAEMHGAWYQRHATEQAEYSRVWRQNNLETVLAAERQRDRVRASLPEYQAEKRERSRRAELRRTEERRRKHEETMQGRVTTSEAATLLGVTGARVKQLIAMGQLHPEKIGRGYALQRVEIEELARKRSEPKS